MDNENIEFDEAFHNYSTLSLLNRGIKNNVIVYDCDAPKEKFTERLIKLMKDFANKYKYGDFIKFHFCNSEDYINLGGSFTAGKTKLVLGEFENNVLLGCY